MKKVVSSGIILFVLFLTINIVLGSTQTVKISNNSSDLDRKNISIWYGCGNDINLIEKEYNPDAYCEAPGDLNFNPIGYPSIKEKITPSKFTKFLSSLEGTTPLERPAMATYYVVKLNSENYKKYFGIELPYIEDYFVKSFKKKCSDYYNCDRYCEFTRNYIACDMCPNKNGNSMVKIVYGYSLKSFEHAEEIALNELRNKDLSNAKEIKKETPKHISKYNFEFK